MIDFLCLSFRRPSAAEIDSRSCRTRPIGAKNGQKTLCYASALYVVYTSHYTIAQVYASRRCTGIVGERRTISSARNIMMSRTRFCSSECEQCCRSGDRKKKPMPLDDAVVPVGDVYIQRLCHYVQSNRRAGCGSRKLSIRPAMPLCVFT